MHRRFFAILGFLGALAPRSHAQTTFRIDETTIADVHRLEREGVRWARALALLVRASIDRDRAAATLKTAVAELDACELGLYADAARRRLAVVEAGNSTSPNVRAADVALIARGVRNPVRMTAMLAP